MFIPQSYHSTNRKSFLNALNPFYVISTDRNPALGTWRLNGLMSLQREVLTFAGNSRLLASPPPSFYTFPRMTQTKGEDISVFRGQGCWSGWHPETAGCTFTGRTLKSVKMFIRFPSGAKQSEGSFQMEGGWPACSNVHFPRVGLGQSQREGRFCSRTRGIFLHSGSLGMAFSLNNGTKFWNWKWTLWESILASLHALILGS